MSLVYQGKTYEDGDPNTPSALRTAANGWSGSQYTRGATPAPAPTPTGPPVIPPVAPNAAVPRSGQPPGTPPAPAYTDPQQQAEANRLWQAAYSTAPLGDPNVPNVPTGMPPTYPAGATSGATPTVPAAGGGGTKGDYAGFGRAWLASGGRTVADLQAFVAAHPEYGATLGGSKGEKVTIGGRTFDAVIAAGAGGRGASWYDITGGNPLMHDGIPGNAAGGGKGATFPAANIFTDPASKALEEFLRTRLANLQAPVSSPERDALMRLLTGARDAGPSQDAQALTAFGRQRFQSLQGDPFSGTEEQALRVERFSRMEQDRQAEKRRVADQLMAQGHAPGSGTIVQALADIDTKYDRLRSSSENQLLTYTIGERQNRQREAVGLGDFLQQQARGQTIDRLGYGTAAAGVETGARAENEGRQREALSVASVPVEMTQQRLQLALQSLGLGQAQSGTLINALLGIGNQGLQQQQINNAGWQGFGQLLTQLAALYRPQQPAATTTTTT